MKPTEIPDSVIMETHVDIISEKLRKLRPMMQNAKENEKAIALLIRRIECSLSEIRLHMEELQ